MALILHRYYSYALTECDSMTVIIPEEKFPGKTFPVLWLLSPLGTDHTGWQRFGSAENLADEKGYIVPGLGDAGDRIFNTVVSEKESIYMNL